MAEIVEVEIESLNAAGDGAARRGTQRITVPITMPGERVRIRLGPRRASAATASLLEVLRPSPHRVVARCRHFGPPSLRRDLTGAPGAEGACGGCAWQHIAYPEQLRLKADLITRLVRDAVTHAPAARPMLAGAHVETVVVLRPGTGGL